MGRGDEGRERIEEELRGERWSEMRAEERLREETRGEEMRGGEMRGGETRGEEGRGEIWGTHFVSVWTV